MGPDPATTPRVELAGPVAGIEVGDQPTRLGRQLCGRVRRP
jgi:hypothetical protein